MSRPRKVERGLFVCDIHGDSDAYVHRHILKSGPRKGKLATSTKCGECLRERSRILVAKAKAEMLIAYGGKCVCCGEENEKFLTIDHIFGDGQEERKKLGYRGGNMYTKLMRLGFPKDRYRLLCMNCNWATGRYGKCPHENGVECGEA